MKNGTLRVLERKEKEGRRRRRDPNLDDRRHAGLRRANRSAIESTPGRRESQELLASYELARSRSTCSTHRHGHHSRRFSRAARPSTPHRDGHPERHRAREARTREPTCSSLPSCSPATRLTTSGLRARSPSRHSERPGAIETTEQSVPPGKNASLLPGRSKVSVTRPRLAILETQGFLFRSPF